MPDILDDLRAELDSAFERAEDATDVQRRRRRWSGRARHAPARRAAGTDAAAHVRELPRADAPQVGLPGPYRRFRGLTILAPVTAAAVALAVFVAPALNRERIPADERPAPAAPPPLGAGAFSAYGPVDANVSARPSSARGRQVTIDKGLDDGVHRGDPVIDETGLVGTVTRSAGGSSVVTLITDPSFATSVYAGQSRNPGSITTALEPSGELLFEPVNTRAKVRETDLVSTAGTTNPSLRSRYPRAIPVGRVSRVVLGDSDLDTRIYVRPAADLQRIDAVQVLTDPYAADASG